MSDNRARAWISPVRQLLMGHAAGREAHDRYGHAVGVLLRAADLVAGELARALRGEDVTAGW
jgi:hypothetical protein